MSFIIMNEDTIKELEVASEQVVEFSAPWCGYCKRLEPALKQIANNPDFSLNIAQVNIDDFEAFANKYGIETIPTLLVLRNGEASKELIAPQAKADVMKWLKEEGVIK